MFRFSSGLTLYGGNENDQGYLIYESSNKGASFFTGSDIFHPCITSQGKRKWDLKPKGILKSTHKPLDIYAFDLLIKDLDYFNPKTKHPAIEIGLENEIQRLFPEVEKEVVIEYKKFIFFLEKEFGLQKEANGNQVLKVYTDDLGPCMATFLEDKYVLPPEVPPLYYAPKDWRIITWWINNYFSGPYPEDAHPEILKALNGERFYWDKLQIIEAYKNKKTEGLVYFLIAKFIIIYEAWMYENNGINQAQSLIKFIDLIQNKNQRPWQILY